MTVSTTLPSRPSGPPAASAAPPPTARSAPLPATRDTGIDLVRALCLLAILVLHGLQVSVTLGTSGPILEYATRGASWYPPLTWILQVMPVFFVIGGFAGLVAHRRSLARGGTSTGFVAGRVHRLLLPAVVTIGAVGLVLALLLGAGAPAELIGQVGMRYSEPLWFLGVFLACQALLPAQLALHERAPWALLAALATAAVGVDVLRSATGLDALGYANLAFVWLALQQLGFFLAEGRLDRLPVAVRSAAGVAAVAALVLAVATGAWSADLIAHMNPPTTALLLVGLAQTLLISLLRAPLVALSIRPRLAALTRFVTAHSMTIYLWNLPMLLLAAGVSAQLAMLGAGVLPAPPSLGWWTTRPAWLVVTVLLTAGAGWLLGGIERRRMPNTTGSSQHVLQAVLLALVAVLLILLAGATPVTAAVAVGLGMIALRRIRAGGHREDSSRTPNRHPMFLR
ncbi:acyltransferase family protein [Brachybacterium sacelli]|uniref:Peptidoglycan/LPS O-acetylase OafA/YrhL n=1 Tax=Brachybacterium sacelli TaxID=173364 RepID=A0ABS4X4D0_9MICO|nr:acyltransferase [Brachybacterium sacelli]MBP2383093.1 peptidoglycan/LPS O-acetylase OafA/YrhL [Brachybacterium sacelli]